MTTALLTGAPTGLGLEFVKPFAAHGVDVILVSSSRTATKLEERRKWLVSCGHATRSRLTPSRWISLLRAPRPGPTRTEFFATAGLRDASRLGRVTMDAATAAAAGYAAMRAGRITVMPRLATKAMRAAACPVTVQVLTGLSRATSSLVAEDSEQLIRRAAIGHQHDRLKLAVTAGVVRVSRRPRSSHPARSSLQPC